MKFTKFIFLVLSIMMLAWPIISFADAENTKQLVPTEHYEEGDYTIQDFTKMAIFVGKVILGLAGSAALVMFIVGGIQMIIAAGNSENFKKGQQTLINALIGLVVIFCSYIIINFVLNVVNVAPWARNTLDQTIKKE